MANLLEKASILITPTAFDNGSINAIKPIQTIGDELVTNGDFATDSDWSKVNATISNGEATITVSNGGYSSINQSFTYISGRKYRITAQIQGLSGSSAKQIRLQDRGDNTGGLNSLNGKITLDETLQNIDITWTANSNSSDIEISRHTNSGDYSFSIDNVSVKQIINGDLNFTRDTLATRLNAQGLVEDVNIIGTELVENGDFSEIGSELVTNGDFSQEGSELVTNGDFSSDSNWSLTGATINGGKVNVNSSNPIFIVQLNVATVGKIYKVELTVSDYVEGDLRLRYPFTVDESEFTGNGTYVFYGTADDARVELQGRLSGQTYNYSIDNVSVKEVGQDWDFTNYGGTHGWRIADGRAICDTSAATAFRNLNSNYELQNGKTYKLTLDILQSEDNMNLMVGENVVQSGGSNIDLPIGENLGYVVYFTAPSTGNFRIYGQTSDLQEITNISVKEVGQDFTFGDGWSVDQENSKASCDGTQTAATNLEQRLSTNIQNDLVRFSFNLSDYSAGNLSVSLSGTGGTDFVNLNQNGNYEINVTSTDAVQDIVFQGDADFIGSVSNISIKQVTEDTNLPRIDYTGGVGHWLIEPQSTNLIIYSEDFGRDYWNLAGGDKTSGQLSPNGDNSAYRIDFDGSGIGTFLRSGNMTLPANTTYTASWYIKNINLNDTAKFKIENISGGGTGAVNIDTLQSYGTIPTDKFTRYSITFTTGDASGEYKVRVMQGGSFNNANSFIIANAQLEQQSYATSYIPTSEYPKTRAEETANNSGNSDLISSTEGVLYAEIAALADDETNREIQLHDGTQTTNQDFVKIRFNDGGSNRIYTRVDVGGNLQYYNLDTSYNITDTNKIAIRYGVNNFATFINGSKEDEQLSGFTFSANTLTELAFNANFGGNNFYGKIKCVAVFKEALTDEELTCLTT